ncbi:MAG: hypothetical protein AB1Z65_07750 [Candidatus Sulfomarinibacteraceae bacterium]
MKRLLCPVVALMLLAVGVPALAVDIPSTPDGTVRAVAEGLADRHPEILWQALPPTYQKDITELTHAFAERMDPAVWEAAFALGSRTVGLLRDKKDIILSSSMAEAAGEEREEIEGGWDEMVSMFDSFFASGVSSLDTLKTIDWEQYIATTGKELMDLAAEKSKADGDDTFDREFTQKLRQAKVEVISSEGDSATLRMTAPDEEPEEMQLTRVEGRWVPSDMAKDWDKNVAEAKAKLAALTDEEMQQGSMQAMMMIGMVDGVLAQLETVETAEEFDQAIEGLLGPFLGGMMGADEDEFYEYDEDESYDYDEDESYDDDLEEDPGSE